MQIGAKRVCAMCTYSPTELPFCTPPLVVGHEDLKRKGEREKERKRREEEEEEEEEEARQVEARKRRPTNRRLERRNADEKHFFSHVFCFPFLFFIIPVCTQQCEKKICFFFLFLLSLFFEVGITAAKLVVVVLCRVVVFL